MDKIIDTVGNWFDSIGDMGLTHILHVIVLIVSLLVMASIITLCSRFILRYVHHVVRQKVNLRGVEMEWNEVTFTGETGEGEVEKAVAQVANMSHLMFPTTSRWLKIFHWNRALVSLMMRKSKEDDSVHLYIGIDKRHYQDGASLRSWVQGANCEIEKIDFDEIGFVNKAPVTVMVKEYTPQKYTDAPTNSSVGAVMSRFQNLLPAGRGGTALITYEPMRPSERKIFTSHVVDYSYKNGGRSAEGGYNPVGNYMDYFNSNSPSRGVIIGFSDDGIYNDSESIVGTVTSAMQGLGVQTDTRRYTDVNRMAGLWSMIPCALMFVAAYFSIIPWWIPLVSTLFSFATFTGIPFLSTWWIEQASKYGVAPIPPFWRWSWRRLVNQKFVQINRLDFDRGNQTREEDGGKPQKTYTENPSPYEVIPLYTTPLMQFASLPLNRKGMTQVSLSVIPPVAIPSSAVHASDEYTTTGDAIYVGMSAKSNAPVFQTPRDLNFGIAVGGSAGSGKTVLLKTLFIENCRLSRKQDGLFGQTNSDGSRKVTINPIWFETKPDDLQSIIRAVDRYDPRVVKLHDATQPSRLSLEGGRLGDPGVTLDDIQRNAGLLVSSLEAIFGSSFQSRSKEIATRAFMTALLCNKSELETLGIAGRLTYPERPNIMEVVSFLVGAHPEVDIKKTIEALHKETMKVLTAVAFIRDKSNKKDKNDLIAAKKTVTEFFEKTKTKKEYIPGEIERMQMLATSLGGLLNMHNVREAMSPIQSKIPILAKSEGLFRTDIQVDNPDPDEKALKPKVTVTRKEYTIDELFTYGGPVIVDMTSVGSVINEVESRNFIMLVHFMLWQRMYSVAGGWAGKGKFTPIFADEITNFTGRSEDNAPCANLIGEIQDQGRSYGVSHTVGFQSFDQLPNDTRGAILRYDSSVFFSFNGYGDRNEVINQINSDRYIADNIRYFPWGIGVALLHVDRSPVQAFTIRTPKDSDWNTALVNNSEDVLGAFEEIRPKEIEFIKQHKKKKIGKGDDQNTRPDDRDDNTSDDHSLDFLLDGMNDSTNGELTDDGAPPLAW